MNDEFETLWQTLTTSLREPHLFTLPGGRESFHAWYDEGNADKEETIWTKPLQGEKQVRLPQHKANYRTIFNAWTSGSARSPKECEQLTSRGHYLLAIMLAPHWRPISWPS